MSSRTASSRQNRYSLPRRSKHQNYMNIIPLLPDFALIIKNIHKIRQGKEKTFNKIQSKPKFEASELKQPITPLELSPQKIIESHETYPSATIQPVQVQIEQIDKSQCEIIPLRLRSRRIKKAPQAKRQSYFFKKEGKIRDQISFTFFNSIEEYFL